MYTKINLYGDSFFHNKVGNLISSTENKKPHKAHFVFDGSGKFNLFVDSGIFEVENISNTKQNYAWLLESKSIRPDLIEHFKINTVEKIKPFKQIFTHNIELLELNEKFTYLHPTGPWVDDIQLKEKSKLVSMIASTKKNTKMQKLRNKYAKKMNKKIDVFGEGRNQIVHKEEGLAGYYFSIVFENDLTPDYYSEKLLDCFLLKTIPIYFGIKSIGKYFDENGIIWFKEFDLKNLSSDIYYKKLESVNRNYNIVKNMQLPEDFIVDKIL
jgi:hypothetical protein